VKALVTGGAGFIGSHLVDALVRRGDDVRVLDDLSSGRRDNVHRGAQFTAGDVTDPPAVDRAVRGTDTVFHLAALRAVPRSVEHPLATDTVNVHGTLTVLDAALRAGVRRVVFASSSSVYGDTTVLPTPESAPVHPRSPYAVSKLAGEHYCRVFSDLYGLETVVLRCFNVYGPRQRPDAAYAQVVPLFAEALAGGQRPVVHGDGLQRRDFTFVDDAAAAFVRAAAAPASVAVGRPYNVAGGLPHTVLELLEVLGGLMGVAAAPVHAPARPGDVRETWADLSASRRDLGHAPAVSFEDGLGRTVRSLLASRTSAEVRAATPIE
jgi:UDP-glucose 4-epimerase